MAAAVDPRLQDLIGAFGRTLGMPALALDADGFCRLTFDGTLEVNFQADEGGRLMLYSPVGAVAEGRRDEVFEAMLRANLFWQGTRGGTLSVEGDPPRAVLVVLCDWQSLAAPQLAEGVQRFVEAAEDWAGLVAGTGEFDGAPSGDGAPVEGAIDPGFMRI